jgi:hypothetical protein
MGLKPVAKDYWITVEYFSTSICEFTVIKISFTGSVYIHNTQTEKLLLPRIRHIYDSISVQTIPLRESNLVHITEKLLLLRQS